MRIRIKVTGRDGKALELKKLNVQLSGTLVPHCKLKFRDKLADPAKTLEIEKPDAANDIIIVLPPASAPAVLEKLYAGDAAPMLALKASGKPK